MARGPFIEPIGYLIASIYRNNSKSKVKVIRRLVRSEIRKNKDYAEFRPYLSREWPSENSIRAYLIKHGFGKGIKKGSAKYDRKDEPWSIGCLAEAEYDIPPEALPKVIFICEDHFRKFKERLTIRQVLWMARLYKIIDEPIALKEFALMYELHEWFDWVSGNHTDNRSADLAVIQYMARRTKRITSADKIGELDDFYAYIATNPLLFRSLQAWAREDAEEIKKELERKKNERKHKAKKQK